MCVGGHSSRRAVLNLDLKIVMSLMRMGVRGGGFVKLMTPRRSCLKRPEGFSPSVGTRHRLPVRKTPLPEESMVDRSQMMTSHSEEVVNAAMEKKKALGLDC